MIWPSRPARASRVPAAPGLSRRAWLRQGLALGAGAAAVLLARSTRAWDPDRLLKAAQALGPQAVEASQALVAMLLSAAPLDEAEQLRVVNDFFNQRIVFTDDHQAWGRVDHWASPLEMLARGVGDCEDYAIAKYFGLLALGVPARRLRLVYVRAELGGVGGPTQAHMVLAHYASPQAEPLILDNLISELRPSSRRPDLAPVFSFNSEGLWEGTGGTVAGDPTARLSRWRDVMLKARAEGFL